MKKKEKLLNTILKLRQRSAVFSIFVLAFFVFLYSCQNKGSTENDTQEQAAKGSKEHIAKVTGAIDDNALLKAGTTPQNWISHGLDYAETRFSKLNQITTQNVKNLKLEWSYNLNARRGIEATPIVVDGIMYLTGTWSKIFAINVRTGKEIWTYDPKVPRTVGKKACCDVVNRGVAIYKGKVFAGTLDGRLLAIDAATGQKVWEKITVDQSKNYTITGAPRVFKGNVIIGNGGAEMGVRGYITAYDAETGNQKWRWYSVPGDPSKPYEHPDLEAAAKTWDPAGKYWEVGGGGTMWDAMAYDPELDLMYVGVGNGSPWNRRLRSPGGGDNLYLSSIVALDPDDGSYKWHYQEVPGDHWDYTATQPMTLADLEIDGKMRKVILHAPKSGFFYVVDRTNGEFISADKYVNVNWATHYDKKGRPVEVPEAAYKDNDFEPIPGAFGGHNWHPWSYNPNTGLVYFAAQGVPLVMADQKDFKHNTMVPGAPMSGAGWNMGWKASATAPVGPAFGKLVAWDPVKKKPAWEKPLTGPWNGGTLSTEGNLVFHGANDGNFRAFDAKTGEKLWEVYLGTGIVAGPVTYEVDGKQYVTIAAGWGGVYGLMQTHSGDEGDRRVYTFSLDGKGTMPTFPKKEAKALLKGVKYNPEHVAEGTGLYVANCSFCHGVPAVDPGGNIPNLGYSAPAIIANMKNIVLTDARLGLGMPNFSGKLTEEDVTKITAFIQGTADAVAKAKADAQNKESTGGD
ncbi:MAG TPA: PQQ-dependent dehydrogenase, methanol/ethanol family [Microscillaceae bacterium]|nr:PQQ-dependent dehydrogenase, methanol/ethanol family [Microscillaceae bacterium]